MGDRTYATVSINKHYYEQNKDVIDKMGYEYECDEGSEVVTLADDQANYGRMAEIEDFCQEHNIEYNKRWEAGGDYGAGEEYARIVNGELLTHEISDDYATVLQEHKKTMEIIAKGGTLEEVKKHLAKKIKELEPFEVTPLKAPNSIDFINNA